LKLEHYRYFCFRFIKFCPASLCRSKQPVCCFVEWF